jgi:hypothetical protein
VVLDDHKDGYGIYKLDNDHDGDLDGGSGAARLPGPPVVRVAVPSVRDYAQFAAVGSSIVAVVVGCSGFHVLNDQMASVAFIYNVETTAIVVSPQVPEGLQFGYDAAMAVGERLYMLESDEPEFAHRVINAFPGGLHCLAADGDGFKNPSSWRRPLSPSSQWCWSDDLMLPFRAESITAHAVLAPPGSAHHEIFVSAASGTFSFSSATEEWTQRSELVMPVVGHAHYDGELDTWVGLSNAYSDYWNDNTDGHLCAFSVTDAELECKVGTEKLLRLDEDIAAGWRHVDAKLVPIAPPQGGSKYCLMERLRPDGDDREQCLGEGDKCLLRLTSFCLERNKDGDLVTTARRARSYKISRYNVDFHAQAFWM